MTDQLAVVKWLVETGGANIDAMTENPDIPTRYTPLHVATYKRHIETARYLVEKGAALDVRDGDGNTPAEVAAETELPELMSLFELTR